MQEVGFCSRSHFDEEASLSFGVEWRRTDVARGTIRKGG